MEISNLTLLKEKIASSKEYFGEQLQPLLLRKFFFSGEIAEILPGISQLISNMRLIMNYLLLLECVFLQRISMK